ncbi:hypothetical protein F2Q69_00032829 [Brassica cretica]|uniref:non-specific serine/threonine protein kinase n=1 Tax=Brassica cretica TaxID=69181 RepID=A0A8S9SSN8_BRACR|nr:hypothetical protein F2Q69_00032829 [Brassica cretica]
MCSFTALDPSLSPLQFPFFVQTAPSDLFLMRAVAEMITYYGWSDVIALYNDDDNSRNGVTSLGDELEGRRCKISYKAVLPLDVVIGSPREIVDELVKIQGMESRVIIVNTFPKTGRMIFKEAKRLGMMGRGYVWIATTWMTSLLDSANPPSLPKVAKSLTGVLTLRIHTPESRKKRDFAARWKKLSNGTVGLNVYGLYAYDTVWIIARAVKSLLDSGANISFSSDSRLNHLKGGTLNLAALSMFDQGQQFLDYIVETKMSGVTGPVQFLPDRSMIQPAYDIINVVGDGLRQIGYWSNHSGLSVIPPELLFSKPSNRSRSNQHLKNVTWPGGGSVTPRGWVFPNNGRRLRIGVPNRASFKDFVSRVNGSNQIDGYSINVFEAARGHYSERKAAELTKIIVGVVEACHSLGVMHRDLKPENFLLVNKDDDFSLKAIDFGLSIFFKPGQIFTDVVGSPYYVAPEVLLKRYGPEADVWTAGVILYILLSGVPPFWAETQQGIFDAVLKGYIDFDSDPWPVISDSAKDLIRRMLCSKPAERLTAHEVLRHPWICENGVAPDRALDPAVLSRLKQFSAMNKLKKMALKVIAESLSEEEIAGLREMFQAMDTDNSGAITFDELKAGLRKYGSTLKDTEIHDLMEAADVDNSGTIDYSEFIAATIHLNKLEREEHLVAAFQYFDKDGSGVFLFMGSTNLNAHHIEEEGERDVED